MTEAFVLPAAVVAEIERAEAEFREFAATHPHFDAVKSTMCALIQAALREGKVIDLETAYQRAMRAAGLEED